MPLLTAYSSTQGRHVFQKITPAFVCSNTRIELSLLHNEAAGKICNDGVCAKAPDSTLPAHVYAQTR
jgi:hypothetical protein